MVELGDVGPALPLAAKEEVGLRIRVHEIAQRQVEFPHVVTGQLVPGRDAHRARLAVEAVAEPERAHAAADVPRVGLQEGDAVPALFQFIGRHEPGQPGTDDDDMQRRARIGNGGQRRQSVGGRSGARHRHQPAQECAPGLRVTKAR